MCYFNNEGKSQIEMDTLETSKKEGEGRKGGAKTHRSEKKRAEREGAFVFPIHLSKPKTEAERRVLGAQSSAAHPHWAEVAVRGSRAVTSLRRRRAAPHPRGGVPAFRCTQSQCAARGSGG